MHRAGACGRATGIEELLAEPTYPVLFFFVDVVNGITTLMLQGVYYKVKDALVVARALRGSLLFSTVLMTLVVIGLS